MIRTVLQSWRKSPAPQEPQALPHPNAPTWAPSAPPPSLDGKAQYWPKIWSLQHCMYPALQVGRIANALAGEAPFLLVNSLLRLIPTNLGWRSDGEDLDALMGERFTELERLNFTPEVAAADVVDSSSISWWRRRI